MPNLKGSSVNLRALEPQDLEILYTIENNEAFWQVSNTQTPYSKYVLKQYLENSHLDIYEMKQLRLVIENKQQNVVGLIDLFDFNPQHLRAGLGIVILEQYQKNGYAKEALQLLHNYAFSILNLHQIFTTIAIDNLNSISLFKSLKYQQTGIQKNWIFNNGLFKDVYFYQLINPSYLIK